MSSIRTSRINEPSGRTRRSSRLKKRDVCLDTSRAIPGALTANNRKMQEKIILSTISAWELGEKFETTRAQKNEALREAKIAKQDGDLSENAPYQAAKEKFRTMGRVQRRLTGEMNHMIKQGHTIVDPLSWVRDEPAVVAELGTEAEIELSREKK